MDLHSVIVENAGAVVYVGKWPADKVSPAVATTLHAIRRALAPEWRETGHELRAGTLFVEVEAVLA